MARGVPRSPAGVGWVTFASWLPRIHCLCHKGEWTSGFKVWSSLAHPSGPAVALFLFLPFSFPLYAVEGKQQL